MDLIKGFGLASPGFQFRSTNRVGPGSGVSTIYIYIYRPVAQRERSGDSLSCAPKAYVKLDKGKMIMRLKSARFVL